MNQGIIPQAFTRHESVLQATKDIVIEVEQAGTLILDALQAGNTIFTCGNGGSAADAQHLAAEFTCRYKEDRKPLAAILLAASLSHLTAVGNDYEFADIFSREIDALGHEGDLLVAFTTSGSSKNILKAMEAARAKKMGVIVLTGEKGKPLAAKVDVLIAVPSEETARIQEMHELIYHAWCEYIDAKITS